jgi:hydrogenase/urease accessory protein HupE
MRAITIFLTLFFWSFGVFGHQTGESTYLAHVKPDQQVVDVLVSFPGRDAAHHLELDENQDEVISPQEMLVGFDRLNRYVASHLMVTNDGQPCQVVETRQSPVAESPDAYWLMQSYTCEAALNEIELKNSVLLESRGSYTHMGRVQIGERIDATVFNTQFPTYSFSLGAPPTLAELVPRYLWEGVVHIVLGPDHVLFVVLLVLLVLGVRRLLVVVTSFTLAHSVTLILAALEIVDISASIVEPLIAISIGYMALEAIFRKEPPKYLAAYTFAFGLIHGFGFSYVLRDNVGLPTDALVPALASFNVGVELGQVAIILCLYPLRKWAAGKPWETKAVRVVAGLSLVLAVFWLIQRVFF